MDKRIVTDNPDGVGYRDGYDAGSGNGRVSREGQMPDNQKTKYRQGFRRGAKHAAQDNE